MTLGDLQTLRREFMKIYELYKTTTQQILPNWTDLSRSICAKNTTGETMNFWQVLGFISSRSINHELHQAKNPPITLRACFLHTLECTRCSEAAKPRTSLVTWAWPTAQGTVVGDDVIVYLDLSWRTQQIV